MTYELPLFDSFVARTIRHTNTVLLHNYVYFADMHNWDWGLLSKVIRTNLTCYLLLV